MVSHFSCLSFGVHYGPGGCFTIMRLMGHSTVTVSQRYVHPTPEALEDGGDELAPTTPHQFPHSDREALSPAASWLFVFNVRVANQQTQRT